MTNAVIAEYVLLFLMNAAIIDFCFQSAASTVIRRIGVSILELSSAIPTVPPAAVHVQNTIKMSQASLGQTDAVNCYLL